MIETFDKNRKIYAKLSDLQEWDKNKRHSNPARLAELTESIQKANGVTLNPILINQDGYILGGRHNYLALKELGFEEAWVNMVFTSSEDDMMQKRLEHNNDIGYDTPEDIKDLVDNFAVDWSKYTTNIGEPETINDLLKQFDVPEDLPISENDEESTDTPPAHDTQKELEKQDKENVQLNRRPSLKIEFNNQEDAENAKVEIQEVIARYDGSHMTLLV